MSVYTNFFEQTFIFKGLTREVISELLEHIAVEETSYQKGDVIYSPDMFERKIGFVSSGECLVARQAGGTLVPLNTLQPHDSFGIVSVFSDRDEFPTLVKAKTSCTVIFFSSDAIHTLISKNPQVSLNVIEFMTHKINFLNDKIAAFSGGSVEEKLAGYILSLHKKHGKDEFDFNKKKSSEAINCGRASLYRAIDTLEATGYISFENKKIHINDLEGLERIIK